MHNIFEQLNGSDALVNLVGEDSPAAAAQRRVLGRLGDYTASIIAPLNLRPTNVALLDCQADRVQVRISTTTQHVLLVIAPDGDLAAEVFFLRALAAKHLPVPHLIQHDLSCTSIPFTYAIERYVGGLPLDQLEDGPRMRVAARQVGRTLRRVHLIEAPGFGKPTTSGRWPARTWVATLTDWLAGREFTERVVDMLGAEVAAQLLTATLDHRVLAVDRPRLVHGAAEPAHAIVTVGDSAQLEALVRPGTLVGGDPLFDVAHGLLPRYPDAFRQGLLEGYTASGVLTAEQEQRLQRLRLLLWVADTLWNADSEAIVLLQDGVVRALAELR